MVCFAFLVQKINEKRLSEANNSENRNRYSPKGLWWYSEWSPNRYSMNGAFLCFQVAEYTHNDDPRHFAEDQAEYVLGDKSDWSYVIGYKVY